MWNRFGGTLDVVSGPPKCNAEITEWQRRVIIVSFNGGYFHPYVRPNGGNVMNSGDPRETLHFEGRRHDEKGLRGHLGSEHERSDDQAWWTYPGSRFGDDRCGCGVGDRKGGVASAVTSPGSTTGNVAVTSAIALTVNNAAFTLTGVPGSTQANAAAVTYSVTTNNLAGYAVTVQAAAPTLAATATGNADFIPIAALTVKGDAAGAVYTPMSNTTATTVHTQTTRSLSTGDPHSDGYQIVIPFVNQDTYHVTLNYVATTL